LGHPLNAKAIDMDDLIHYIGNWTDLPVVNRTALSGRALPEDPIVLASTWRQIPTQLGRTLRC
jgi:hypothetical protein